MTELEKLCEEWGVSIESYWINQSDLKTKLGHFGWGDWSLKEILGKYTAASRLKFDFSVTLKLPGGQCLTVPYFSGIGHADEASMKRRGDFATLKPNMPTAADVLYCLALDAEAADMTFEQWVDEFGWTDPKTAYSTYQACDTNGKRLIAWLGRDRVEQARNAEH